MGQNENIIVQQLQDIKSNLESRDIAKVYQLCDELKVAIDRYHADESITSRIKIIAEIAQPSTSNLTLNDRVREIDALMDILNAKK
ncbi:MAG: hypothetical protein GKS07_09600 [Nitrosopumilus sp.]|nr:MAG: hypothetical protein GKS07_09600 [Nitrosopumilus sp.]